MADIKTITESVDSIKTAFEAHNYICSDQIATAVADENKAPTLAETEIRFRHYGASIGVENIGSWGKCVIKDWVNRSWQRYVWQTYHIPFTAIQHLFNNNVYTLEHMLRELKLIDGGYYATPPASGKLSSDHHKWFPHVGWKKTRHKEPTFSMRLGVHKAHVSANGKSLRDWDGDDDIRNAFFVELMERLTTCRHHIDEFWSEPEVEMHMVKNFMTGEMVEEPVNTPYNCSVQSEAYWAM